MRIFTATLATETNTFSPLPTSLASYQESVFLRPGEHPDDAPRMCTAPLFVARRRAAEDGFSLIEGSCFAASPAGTTNRQDYEAMRDEILRLLRRARQHDQQRAAIVRQASAVVNCVYHIVTRGAPLRDVICIRRLWHD